MIDKEVKMKKVASLPDADLQRAAEFSTSLEKKQNARKRKADALSGVIGVCEGPKDLVEKHDNSSAC